MIRLSNDNDINGIVAIWKEAFGDSEKDIVFFLEYHYNPENTVVCECNGSIVSVLFLLEGDMHVKGLDYPSYYLYAACTLKEYRGRGLMAELLGFAKSIASERNKFFIALKPADESLYNYYSRFGYQSVFTKKSIELNRVKKFEKAEFSCKNSCENLLETRDKIFDCTDYFKWNNHSINFAIKHHKYYGGEYFSSCNGYMLYSINDGVMHVKENGFTQENFIYYANFIADKFGAEIIRAELPHDFKIKSDKSEIIKSGMLLPVDNEADKLIKTFDNAYLALTLD